MLLQLGNVLRGGIARAWGWHNFTFARHCPWISKANIHFRPSRMRRWISPHPHTSWLCWTIIFAICEIVSLCLGFNLHQPDYYSLRLARLSVFTSLLTIQASCLWVGCSCLCLFFSLVVYLFPLLICRNSEYYQYSSFIKKYFDAIIFSQSVCFVCLWCLV